MILTIIEEPADILRQKTQDIAEITPDILQLMDDMYETMKHSDGVGIAAPQVNENVSVALVQLDDEDELFEMINPVITEVEGSDIFVEGCLSIPHVFGTVDRKTRIVVEYYNRQGEFIRLEAYDYLARAIQHEIDHLNGVLFTDKMIEEIKEEDLESYYEKYESEMNADD
ncbi:MAG: peptide deformylase [Streptococcaceae bacterium]|jgi:peptide deformylase|nr:peptide deformylase [Streptococcaceae bacterium]